MKYSSLSIFAVSLLASTALASQALAAGSTHAKTNYPPAEAMADVDPTENVRGFGRMFAVRSPLAPAGLLPHPSPRYDLVRLGRAMTEVDPADPTAQDVRRLPAAHVFLGQFIDHDLTFDTVTTFDALADTTVIENARTVDLDLDCVYGGGPERDPYLYDGPYLRTGAKIVTDENDMLARYDVLRVGGEGPPTAIIGDPRNDENFMIAQVQSAFVAYHNRMVDRILADWAKRANEHREALAEPEAVPSMMRASAQMDLATRVSEQAARESAEPITAGDILTIVEREGLGEELFEEARAATIHHYHRVIAEDFVPRITGVARTLDIIANGRDFYFPAGFRDAEGRLLEPHIPIEFAVAGYRFAHSLVPTEMPLRGEASEVVAVIFGTDPSTETRIVPRGFTPVRIPGTDHSLAADWNRFVPILAGHDVLRARPLDTNLAPPLGELDEVDIVAVGGLGNLASRNLSRGRTYLLPSGQVAAREILGKLGDAVLCTYGDSRHPQDYVLGADTRTQAHLGLPVTPLWYYILQEAEEFGGAFDADVELPLRVTKMTGASGDGCEADGPGLLVSKNGGPSWEVNLSIDVRLAPQLASAAAVDATAPAPLTGATLGPVGGTIVGEVLLGLIDHFRERYGSGLDLNLEAGPAEPLAYDATEVVLDDSGLPALTYTEVTVGGLPFGERYLFRNFLHDAGVARPIADGAVCTDTNTAAGCE